MTRPGNVDADVVVVGAGPAGSATAHQLARRGYDVVLIDAATFPRDKPCGDGLTTASLDALRTLDIDVTRWPEQRVGGLRVQTAGGQRRDFTFPGDTTGLPTGLVVSRYVLDQRLVEHAASAGARVVEGCRAVALDIDDDGVVRGVHCRRAGREWSVTASFVVLATGAARRLARSAGRCADDPAATGQAMRGYFRVDGDVDPLFHVYAPLTDPSTGTPLCGYGWVFPLRDGLVNAGIGYFRDAGREDPVNLGTLYARFVASLAGEPALAGWQAVSAPAGGRLASGVDATRVHGPGIALVGDAAGLVDPFTGEGIAAALESGVMAARCIDGELGDGSRGGGRQGLPAYAGWVARRYVPRARLGRQVVRTNGYMWNVLEQTFSLDDPIFDALRKVTIDYGAAPIIASAPRAAVDRDVAAVVDRMHDVLAGRNDLAAKLTRQLFDADAATWRVALLTRVAAFGSVDDRATLLDAAAALELSVLAQTIHEGVRETDGDGAAGATTAHWANKFAITVGALLLVESMRILSRLDARLIIAASQVGQAVSAARLARRSATGDEYLELACVFGAVLGGVTGPVEATLRRIARSLAPLAPAERSLARLMDVAQLPDGPARNDLTTTVRHLAAA